MQQDAVLKGSDDMLKMHIINPLALMHVGFTSGSGWSQGMQEAMGRNPASPNKPWRRILYSDEVVPGNVLGHMNKRKVWVIYYSFLELGPALLRREDAWLPLLVKRSLDVNKLGGGLSQLFSLGIKCFFGVNILFAQLF